MSCEDRVSSETCPECGSDLAVDSRSHNGVAVTIAVCTGYPDCTYFRWSVPESDGNPRPRSLLKGVGSWAIDKSLSVLRNKLSSEEWRKALSSFVAPPGEGGDHSG